MEFSTYFLSGYISDLINIRQFKESNSYYTQQHKSSNITECSAVIQELRSDNPNIELPNLTDEMRASNTKLEKQIYKDRFALPDTLGSHYVPPICDSISSKLQTLDSVKSDLCQAMPTMTYAPLPRSTPKLKTITDQTLLITLTFYRSYQCLQRRLCDEVVRPYLKDSIQFHDGQTLGAVRRAFVCQNDMDKEISGDGNHNPHKPFDFLGNNLKNSVFYINNNIYVDSQPDKITRKHSATMKKWAQDNYYEFGDVLSIDTKLIDLEVRIGEPYVYQHSKNCEHLFVFNEIRFAQPDNSLGFSSYPRIMTITKEKLKRCMFCNKCISDVVIVPGADKSRLRVNRMCERCFISFNYNNIAEKVMCFKIYRSIKLKN